MIECPDCFEYLIKCPHYGKEVCPVCGKTAEEIKEEETEKDVILCFDNSGFYSKKL